MVLVQTRCSWHDLDLCLPESLDFCETMLNNYYIQPNPTWVDDALATCAGVSGNSTRWHAQVSLETAEGRTVRLFVMPRMLWSDIA